MEQDTGSHVHETELVSEEAIGVDPRGYITVQILPLILPTPTKEYIITMGLLQLEMG